MSARSDSAVEYTIAAIPTVYRGRRYRSRLEARWAAFFDCLGWQHEYEPFDLGGWSPDFLLPAFKALVEVKPLESFSQEVWDKMVAACLEHDVEKIVLTRTAPAMPPSTRPLVEIGWMGWWPEYRPIRAMLGWLPQTTCPEFYSTLVDVVPGSRDKDSMGTWWQDFATGRIGFFQDPLGQGAIVLSSTYNDHTMRLWAEATNAAQYRPEQ
jgi:hypothetical protein